MIQVGAITDRGLKRTRNEDGYATSKLSHKAWLLVVADGMGGHGDGEIASRAAIRSVTEYILNTVSAESLKAARLDDIIKAFEKSFDGEDGLTGVREAVYDAQMSIGNSKAGTTLIFAVVTPGGHGALGWCGDCRAYIGTRDELKPLHEPHNLAWSRMMASIYPDDSEDKRKKYDCSNIVTRSVGGGGREENWNKLETMTFRLRRGERLLLASDGVWGEIPDADLHKALMTPPSAGGACQLLKTVVHAAGASDNLTAVVAEKLQ